MQRLLLVKLTKFLQKGREEGLRLNEAAAQEGTESQSKNISLEHCRNCSNSLFSNCTPKSTKN